jgi:hypothetical protein
MINKCCDNTAYLFLISLSAIMPLWTILFENELYGHPGYLAIPFMDMFILLFIILGASFTGFLLHSKWPVFYDNFWIYLPLFSVITMLFIIAMELYNNIYIIANVTGMRFFIASILAGTGFSLGAGIGYLTRQSKGRLISLALETGVRTSYITNLCVTVTYSAEEARVVKTIPVLCGLLTVVPSFVIVMMYRIRRKCKMLEVDIAFQKEQALAQECLSMMREQNQNEEEKEHMV